MLFLVISYPTIWSCWTTINIIVTMYVFLFLYEFVLNESKWLENFVIKYEDAYFYFCMEGKYVCLCGKPLRNKISKTYYF